MTLISTRRGLTFIEVGSHPLVVGTNESIILLNRKSCQKGSCICERMLTSYKLVPWTAKKLSRPLAFPFTSSNLNTVISLSWSYWYLARSAAGLARYAVGDRLMFAFKMVAFPTLSLPGARVLCARVTARTVPAIMASAVCLTYPRDVI